MTYTLPTADLDNLILSVAQAFGTCRLGPQGDTCPNPI